VKARWQRRPLRVRLAVCNAVAAGAAGAICAALGAALGIWKPANLPDLLAPLAWIWAGVMVIFSVGAYLIARRMLAPLEELVTQSRRLSAKGLSQRLPVTNPHDEVGQLAAGLNDMLENQSSCAPSLSRMRSSSRSPTRALASRRSINKKSSSGSTSPTC